MALRTEKKGQPMTTTAMNQKPRLCHTCKERKQGLFTVDAYANPMCADCARAAKRPID